MICLVIKLRRLHSIFDNIWDSCLYIRADMVYRSHLVPLSVHPSARTLWVQRSPISFFLTSSFKTFWMCLWIDVFAGIYAALELILHTDTKLTSFKFKLGFLYSVVYLLTYILKTRIHFAQGHFPDFISSQQLWFPGELIESFTISSRTDRQIFNQRLNFGQDM